MKAGLIGLGNMGGRIAKSLLKQGIELTVFDVNTDVMKEFEVLGAKTVHSLPELTENNECFITILPNAQIVKSVVLGEKGLASNLMPGSILIDMTSSDPTVTKEIGRELSKKGIHMVDAPVSGGLARAEDGTLSIMVGGEEAVVQKTLSILGNIGSNIIHVGELGAGHTIKALNNLMCAASLSITAEALAIGVKMGLDPHKMLQVINSSSGRNQASEVKFPQQVLTRKFEVGFTIDLMCKDIMIALDMARNVKVPMFVGSSVFESWMFAVSQGGGDLDHTAIAKFVEQMANIEIV